MSNHHFIDAQYRIIRFTLARGTRYVGLAWNYEQACLISTLDYPNYTEARASLEKDCQERCVRLRWFDGEYQNVGGELVSVEDSFKNELDFAAGAGVSGLVK